MFCKLNGGLGNCVRCVPMSASCSSFHALSEYVLVFAIRAEIHTHFSVQSRPTGNGARQAFFFCFLRRRVPTEMAARNYGRKNVKKYANCSSLDALQEFLLGIKIRT